MGTRNAVLHEEGISHGKAAIPGIQQAGHQSFQGSSQLLQRKHMVERAALLTPSGRPSLRGGCGAELRLPGAQALTQPEGRNAAVGHTRQAPALAPTTPQNQRASEKPVSLMQTDAKDFAPHP